LKKIEAEVDTTVLPSKIQKGRTIDPDGLNIREETY